MFFVLTGIYPLDRNVFSDDEFTSQPQETITQSPVLSSLFSARSVTSEVPSVEPSTSVERTYQLTETQIGTIVESAVKSALQRAQKPELPLKNRLQLIIKSNNNITCSSPAEVPQKRTRGRPKKVVQETQPKKRGRQQGQSRVLTSSPVREAVGKASSVTKSAKKRVHDVNTMVMTDVESMNVTKAKKPRREPLKAVENTPKSLKLIPARRIKKELRE